MALSVSPHQDLSSDFHPAFFTDISPHYKTATKSPIVFLHKYQVSIGQRLTPTPGHLNNYPHVKCALWVAQLGIEQCLMTEALSLLPGNLSEEVALKFTSSPVCCQRLSVLGVDAMYPASSLTAFHSLVFSETHNRKLQSAFKA